jgi:hypothetical protein
MLLGPILDVIEGGEETREVRDARALLLELVRNGARRGRTSDRARQRTMSLLSPDGDPDQECV